MPTAPQLGARDDAGQPVDWWFMYKVSKQAHVTSGAKPTGAEYIYADANSTKRNLPLALSGNRMDQPTGALFHTLNQVYGAAAGADQSLGWFFYNDQYPIGKQVGSRGHTKGALAFDLASDSAFWLLQSMPNCPLPGAYGFPSTGYAEAQTYLCVTLNGTAAAETIAKSMYFAQQPNVYAHSAIPAALKNSPADHRVLLMNDTIDTSGKPTTCDVPLASRGGEHFRLIAKNKQWNNDFYNDLVGPALKADLEIETWLHHAEPPDTDSDKIHRIEVMKSVDLAPLKLPFSWSDEVDHAKLAISHPSETTPWVCVGDINFTTSMRDRGGGTLAFQNADLWKNLNEILSDREEPAKPTKRAKP